MEPTSLLSFQAADFLKAIGMVGAALWVAWTFHKLQKPLAAELENRKTLIDIQKGTLEKEELRTQLLGRQPNPEITLEISHYTDEASLAHAYVVVSVTIANRGTRNFEIEFPESTIAIARVSIGADGELKIIEAHRSAPWYIGDKQDKLERLPNRGFRVGAVRRMVFVMRCGAPGIYLVQFQAPYVRTLFEDDTRKTDRGAQWIEAVEQAIYQIPGSETPRKSSA
jgi:hypothetical protein